MGNELWLLTEIANSAVETAGKVWAPNKNYGLN